MPSATVELRNIEGTQASMGWAGGHTVVVDRPEGRAGGMGLGFNGAQLLALALGGCFCNDMRYTAERWASARQARRHRDGRHGGEPLATTVSRDDRVLRRRLTAPIPKPVIEEAKAICMVANTLP